MGRGLPRQDHTEVSYVIKYLVFGFNILFWIFGGAICGVGLWSWAEKDMFQKLGQLTHLKFDPALIFIIVGAIVFIIALLGCVGALRENTVLLLVYTGCLVVILCAQLLLGILAFTFKDWFCAFVGVILFLQLGFGVFLFIQRQWVRNQIENELLNIITVYRDDPDLQDLIDWVQKDWLSCCGIKGPDDWNANIYFNCSSPSREACGVPFSCCIIDPEVPIINTQCGYDIRRADRFQLPNAAISQSEIHTMGCFEAGEAWLNKHLLPVAGVAVAIALIQILGICFAQNLRSDIEAQKSKWHQ